MARPTWSIGELAARTGLSVKTVRYYSDSGLLPVAERSPGGHRRYGPDALERLGLIRRLRALDMPITAITGIVTGEHRLGELLSDELAAVQEHLEGLRWRQALLQALDDCADEERLRRLELLSRVSRLPQAQVDLRQHWERALPKSLPRQVADTLIGSASPEPPEQPSAQLVLAYAELHLIANDPRFADQMIFPVDAQAGVFYTGLLDSVAVAREALIYRCPQSLAHATSLLAQACARAYRTDYSESYQIELSLYFQARPLVPRYWNLVSSLSQANEFSGAVAYTRLIQQFHEPRSHFRRAAS